MPETGNLEYALEYARRGWKVFPLFYVLKGGGCSCRPRPNYPCKRIGKHPMTKNGVQDATTDEATIRRWWDETPWANIGLATGHDGLVVMDVDSGPKLDKEYQPTGQMKKGNESLAGLVEANQPLPATRVCETGSGGHHYYFLSIKEISNSQSKIGADLDVRGSGGYVILPPSNHMSGGKYKWATPPDTKIADMPDWLETLCGTGSKIGISQDPLQEEVIKDAFKTKLPSDLLIRLLDFIPPDCDRETWWQVGAVLKHELGDKKGFEAWDEWSQKAPDQYDPKVMPVQWNSFTDKGLKVGTLFHFAKTLGNFRGFDTESADAPEFRNNWCFVAAIKRFVEVSSFIEWDREQFDAMTLHQFQKGRPSDHILKNEQFRKIQGATYWPEQTLFVTECGQQKLNYWRPSGVTPAPGPVEPFLKHISYLYPDPEEAKILLQYLAYQVQHPGKKVH